MRNLKRVLSLALAMIMLVGMMAIGAGAVNLDDFTDREDIHNDEAVLVLTTLGVINGQDDGSFNPAGDVSRGEMAKMICIILSGGTDPLLAETIDVSFNDTANHWAGKYIEYCASLGIVSGRGDPWNDAEGLGRPSFDPDGKVTVAEAAKMLLTAVGYNAAIEGYSGTASWQLNVDARANSDRVGLYDRLTNAGVANTSVVLTRENAAQMCYNTLDVHMVTYNYGIAGIVEGNISTSAQADDTNKGTVLWELFGITKVTGVVTANNFADLNRDTTNTDKATNGSIVGGHLNEGETRIFVTNFRADGNSLDTTVRQQITTQNVFTNGEKTFLVDTDETVLGLSVSVFVKPARGSINPREATVIGSVVIDDTNVVIEDSSTDTAETIISNNGLMTGLNNATNQNTWYVYNYNNRTNNPDDVNISAVNGLRGVVKQIIDVDGDNVVDYVFFRELRLGKVTTTGENSLTVAVDAGSYKAEKADDIMGLENVSTDMYVLTAFMGGRLHVQEAEKVTGTFDNYTQNATSTRNNKFTVAGTEYDISQVRSYTGDVTKAEATVDDTVLGNSTTFYLDENGYVIAYGKVDLSVYKYALVWLGSATNIEGQRVKATLSDGTTDWYTVNSGSDIVIVADAPGAADTSVRQLVAGGQARISESGVSGMLFTYTVTSTNKITLRLPNGGAIGGYSPRFTKGLPAVAASTWNVASAVGGFTTRFFVDVAARAAAPGVVNRYNIESPIDVIPTGLSQSSNQSTAFFNVTVDAVGAITNVSAYKGYDNMPSIASQNQGAVMMAIRNEAGTNNTSVAGAVAFFDVTAAQTAGKYMIITKSTTISGETVTVEGYLDGSSVKQTNLTVNRTDSTGVVYNSQIPVGIYSYTKSGDVYTITRLTNEPYYLIGQVQKVDGNTITLAAGAGSAILGTSSLVVDNVSDIAGVGGTVTISKGDTVQVIVNNTTDRVILGAIITAQDELDWQGQKPSDATETTWDNLATAFVNSTKVYVAGDQTVPAGGITVPANATLYIGGSLTANANITLGAGSRLFVKSDLTLGANLTAPATSALVVNNTLTVAAAGSINIAGLGNAMISGTVRVGHDMVMTNTTTLTVNQNADVRIVNNLFALPAAGAPVGTAGILNIANNGHLEAAQVNAGIGAITDLSSNSLVVEGDIMARNLTVGAAGTPGNTKAARVLLDGTLTAASGKLNVSGEVEAANVNPINGDDIELSANTLTLTSGGTVTITGNAGQIALANVKSGTGTATVDTSGVDKGSTAKIGYGSSSNYTLKGKVTGSVTYAGRVTIDATSGVKVDAGLTINVTGALLGVENIHVVLTATSDPVAIKVAKGAVITKKATDAEKPLDGTATYKPTNKSATQTEWTMDTTGEGAATNAPAIEGTYTPTGAIAKATVRNTAIYA